MVGRVVFLGGLVAILGAAALVAPPVAGTDGAVRACGFVPGRSVPASMPPGVGDRDPSPTPRPLPPPTGHVDAATAENQLRVLDAMAAYVHKEYLYPERTGLVWKTMLSIARSRIAAGLDDRAFETLLDWVVDRLGDDHSFVDSPTDVAEEDASAAGRTDFVGIGVFSITPAGSGREAVVAVFPDSPAESAGLRPHDAMLAVDRKPFWDEAGNSRTRGPDGTSLTLTVQRPGEGVRDLTIVRHRVTGRVPVEVCLVPGSRIGYILLPTLTDETVDDQVRDDLRTLTADGPLDGLVLDDRANLGGYGTVLDALLASFTGGQLGSWVDRHRSRRLELDPVDIGGSQTVPLIVLVGPDTESYAEILAGVLHQQGRATLVGAPTHSNVEQLNRFDLPEGWRLWLATTAFRPIGGETGSWERTGIVPDVPLPARWDLFTEATDPALAVAVDLLDGG